MIYKIKLKIKILITVSILAVVVSPLAANTLPNLTCIGDLTQTSNTKNYENNARNLALKYKLSELDVLTRLIYSEGLSTGCLGHELCSDVKSFKENIFEKIGWGIYRRKKKSFYEVVFKKGQFRTSFSPIMSGGKKNIYAEFFLCPNESKEYLLKEQINYKELFHTAFESASKMIKLENIPNEYKNATNFFYPKSNVFGYKVPSWAKQENLIKNISNEWVQFFHVK